MNLKTKKKGKKKGERKLICVICGKKKGLEAELHKKFVCSTCIDYLTFRNEQKEDVLTQQKAFYLVKQTMKNHERNNFRR